MTNSVFTIHRASPLAGLVTLLTLALVLSFQPAKALAQTNNSIFGVSIGDKFTDVRLRLHQLGTSGGRDTRDGGRKEAWALKVTDFSYVTVRANKQGKIVWVSGFLRPGKELPFTKLGDLALAKGATRAEAIWNVETPEGGYRLVAKGLDGKATVIYLLSLATQPIE